MEKEISRLEKILTNLELGDEMNKLTLPTRDGWKKSPVKELINIFENKLSMTRSPSNSQDNSRQEVGRIKFDKIKIFEKEDGQEQQTDTHNMVTVVNTNSNASNITMKKPMKENCIPDGRKIVKKRVWTKLKSGLFGWKTLPSKPTHSSTKLLENIHQKIKLSEFFMRGVGGPVKVRNKQ